jgi:hypothetical protein
MAGEGKEEKRELIDGSSRITDMNAAAPVQNERRTGSRRVMRIRERRC